MAFVKGRMARRERINDEIMPVLSFFATNTATGIRVISDKISHDKSQVFTTHGHFQEDLSHRNFANNHDVPLPSPT
jgi:hypothetical protein